MQVLFDREAKANNVYPIDPSISLDRFLAQDVMLGKQDKYVYWGAGVTVPRYRSPPILRSEEHTSELQSLMRISYAVFCWKKKKTSTVDTRTHIYSSIVT